MMIYRRVLLICLSFCALFHSASAQKEVSFFADSLRKGAASRANTVVAKDQYFYIGGQAHDSLNFYYLSPSIIKVDTLGQTLWTFTTSKQTDEEDDFFGGLVYSGATIDRLLLDGEFLYATCILQERRQRELWKIDGRTGNLVWKKKFDVRLDGHLTVRLAGNGHLAMGYNVYGDEGYVYELVDKKNGGTTLSKKLRPLTGVQTGCFFEIDSDGGLYVSRYDSLFKYTTPSAEVLQWSARVPGVDVNTIRFESNNELYVFGKTRSLAAARLDKSTGAVVWSTASELLRYYLEDQVSDVKLTTSHIYISGRLTLYGSSFSAYHVWKVNRSDGSTLWDKAYNNLWYQDTIPTCGTRYTAIVSMALDAAGNVYSTGYQQAGDNNRGVWGVCKLDGTTGALIYQHPVYADAAYLSTYSTGVYTYPYNNRIFYIGDLQKDQDVPGPMPNHSYSNTFLLVTDTSSTLRVQRKKQLLAPFQYFSKVASIKSYSATKYAVYKQQGRWGMLELRNSANGSLLWAKTIARSSVLTADQLCITADQKIAVTALGHLPTYHMPQQYDYKKKPDSIYFLKFDSTGNLADEKKFFIGDHENFSTIQLFCSSDTNTVLVFNQKDDYEHPLSVHVFNADKGTRPLDFSAYIGARYTPIATAQQLLVPLGKDSAMVIFKRFQPVSPTSMIFQTFSFKTDLVGSGIKPLSIRFPPVDMEEVYNLASIDTASVLIMGKTNTGLATIARYDHKTMTLAWSHKEAPGYSIVAATGTGRHMYWTGVNNTGLVVRQSNLQDGTRTWEYNLAAGSQKYFVPQNQHYNTVRKEYVVTGYMVDSAATVYRAPFYVVVDSLGKLKTFWTGTPDLNMENGLSAVAVTQYGQTLIGGAYYKLPHGRSGVLIEADSALVSNVTTGLQTVKAKDFTITVLSNPVSGSAIHLLIETPRTIPDLAVKLVGTSGAVHQQYRFKNVRAGKSTLRLDHLKGRGAFYLQVEDKASRYTVGVMVL